MCGRMPLWRPCIHWSSHYTNLCKGVQGGTLDYISIANVVFIELLNVLLLNAVNDALYTNVGDGLLKVECLLKILHVCLKAEKFALGSVAFDGCIDCRWLNKAVGRGNGPACDSSIAGVIKNQCQ